MEKAAWLACVSQGRGTGNERREAGWAISWKETVVRTQGHPEAPKGLIKRRNVT